MTHLSPGDPVFAGNTRATFVKYVGAPYGAAESQAVIQVGMDTRVVDPVALRKAN